MMLCDPTGRLLMLSVATPLASSATLPMTLPPSLKLTFPVGVPPPGGAAVTVALKITGWPNTEVAGDAVRTAFVPEGLTVTVWALELLALKLPSPAYLATMLCAPTGRVWIDRVA